jgi:hypothetical protein
MDRNVDALPATYLSKSAFRDQATIDYLGFIVANPFAGLIPGQSLNGATVSRRTLLTPFPEFTGLTLQGTNAASSYFLSADMRVEKRISHGLSVLANFTYSKLIARDNYKNATDTQPEKRVAADVSNQAYTIEQAFVDITALDPTGEFAPFDLLPQWDYRALAKAFGARGYRVETVADSHKTLTGIKRLKDVPSLVEVVIPQKDLAPQLKRLAETPPQLSKYRP